MLAILALLIFFFFFFNDTATTEIYTLSLHDALPIYPVRQSEGSARGPGPHGGDLRRRGAALARRGERARGAGRGECGGDRSPHPVTRGLGDDHGIGDQNEQGARRLRGRAVVGLWRRDRRPH